MTLRVIAIGQKLPGWVSAASDDYVRRLPNEFRLEIIEVAAAKRNRGSTKQKLLEDEGKRILARISAQALVIALDSKGSQWSNEQLAQNLSKWVGEYGEINFIVGGPDGLAPQCLARADRCWSLSNLTFPHTLVRILIAEQLYRTYTILQGHPYHKGH